jgi:type I restriction enzyme, R subunit
MFDEINGVEELVRDICTNQLGWQFIPGRDLPRNLDEVLVYEPLCEALIRLNPAIAETPACADEVIYRLNAILLSVRQDGLVRANENFNAWLRGEKSMPFGPNGEHVTIRLIDTGNLRNNSFVISTQVIFKPRSGDECRFDMVLYVNGIPLVVGEAKTPVRPAISWVDGAIQCQDYQRDFPEFFAPNVFMFATEGKTYCYGAVRMPVDQWGPWREEGQTSVSGLSEVRTAVGSQLHTATVLDFLQHFTLFATDREHRKIKIIARYQQYFGANQIVERVVNGYPKKGLLWHFQGSGKSLLMVFAAGKLRLHPALRNPTVLIVVDRADLDTQISSTFNVTDVPNVISAESRADLHRLLAQDTRKVIITTIHKFGEAGGLLNDRDNIIVMVDEAHRTQEGNLGRQMREALPNAFLFGLTGTPINKRDRNTFWAFGAEEDTGGYMSRYSFETSIRDRATLPLHFEARLVELHVDRDAIDEAYAELTGGLSDLDRADLAHRSARMSVLLKSPERIQAIVDDVVAHFDAKVAPNGFKAQVVVYDRAACVAYKDAFDQLLPPEASTVVISAQPSDPKDWKQYDRGKAEEERVLDNFRDPNHPLKILIVTAKLLTGFDAPILQAMYLDRPLKDHNLLQAICRTNRPYTDPGLGIEKSHGLIVDYLGIFDDVARSLDFDEQTIQQVVSNIEDLKKQIPQSLATCLAYFDGVDRTFAGYEGLEAAQDCLPDNARRDAFAADFSVLARFWETISPDPVLKQYEGDFRWLGQVHQSIKPPGGHGKLLWHALGAKTLELIHENIHVENIRDDLDTLVMDADFIEEFINNPDLGKTKEVEIEIVRRLRKHQHDPVFVELGQRLEELREKHEQGMITSIEFLKYLLQIAREVVEAEKNVDTVEEQKDAKAALTELFYETRNDQTPAIVERIVNDIDEIVRLVRFEGWQTTTAGEREVQRALRRTLLKYQLHKDNELFAKAYDYVRQYY